MSRGIKKGIILAGGSGTRLDPVTRVACKQLLPLFDKPMIYYPLSTLMLAGIRELLIISTPEDTPRFEELLGDGAQLGLHIDYAVQPSPDGIAQALLIGREFINGQSVALILGDNIFYGAHDFSRDVSGFESGSVVYAYQVRNPQRYGVVGFDENDRPASIIEKPSSPQSNYVVTGLYLYDARASELAARLTPSERGELEITDINQAYLEQGKLRVVKLGPGFAWLDTGTFESLLEAGNFISTVEKRQGQKVACVEEIAARLDYISHSDLDRLLAAMPDNSYRAYLTEVAEELSR